MKPIYRILGLAYALALSQTPCRAQGIVGYFNRAFLRGDNLFGNPLEAFPNSLSAILPAVPDGTTVSLWSPTADTFVQTSTYASGTWSVNFVLDPGQGSLLHTPSAFTNTFVGVVLAPDGSVFNPDGPVLPPPPFAGPAGVYLLSSRFPVTLSPTSDPVFDFILGRGPLEGEQFTSLDPRTQTYHTTTFSSGAWNNGDPVLHIGEAAFFSVVPEPSTLGLSALAVVVSGLVVVCRSRNVQRRAQARTVARAAAVSRPASRLQRLP